VARGYKIADGYIEITVETDKGDRQIKRFLRDTRGRLHDEQGRYASEGELAGIAWADKLTKGADKESEKGFRGMFSRWGKKFAGFGRTLGGLFANKFVAIAAAGLGALPSAISAVTSALGSAINIGGAGAALAPAAIAGLLLTVGALKTAFGGLGAALKAGLSGDMQKFAEATKDMAPALQQVAKTLVQLNPLIKILKQSVQQSFFFPLLNDVKPLAMTYLPMVYKTMGDIARAFGNAAHEVAGFLIDPGVIDGMRGAFDNIGVAGANIAKVFPPVVRAFQTLFQVGASFLPGLTAGFAELAKRFEEFVGKAAETGALQAFIQGGIDKVKALGQGLGDLVGIFRSIGQAASGVTGGGLFSAIGKLLSMVNAFFQTLQGQEVLSNFFSRLQAIGKLIIGLVGGALPGLLAFSSGLLTALQSLAPIAPVVGKAIGDALAALAPLLPVIGKVLAVLLTLASGILSTIAAELGPMISLFAQLATGLADKLLPVISDMISQGLPVAIQLGKNLADAFAPLVPVILQLADAFLGGLVQAMPALLDVAQKLLPVITQLAQQFAGAMLDALNRLQPYIPDMVRAFVLLVEVFAVLMGQYLPNAIRLFSVFFGVLVTVVGWVFDLGEAVASLIGWFGSIGGKVRDFVSSAGSALIGWVSSAASWFASLPGKIWSGLVSLVTMIPQIFDQAIKSAGFAIGFGIGVIINMITGLPHRAAEALSSLGSAIAGVAQAAWAWVTLKFYQGVAAAVNFASNLPGMARNAISALGSLIAGVASDAWNRLKSAFSSGISNAVSLARSLPGRIKDALSGAAGWLYGTGQDVVRGLWNGIKDMIGWIINKGISFGSSVISGIKKGLGIGSPSKRARDEVGRWIPPGIMAGVDREMPKLYKFMDAKMAGLVTRPPAVNVAAPNVNVPPTTVYVLLDSKQIGAQITLDPKRVAAATAEGNRQRSFVNTGRQAGAFG
jgi:phage-related protein